MSRSPAAYTAGKPPAPKVLSASAKSLRRRSCPLLPPGSPPVTRKSDGPTPVHSAN